MDTPTPSEDYRVIYTHEFLEQGYALGKSIRLKTLGPALSAVSPYRQDVWRKTEEVRAKIEKTKSWRDLFWLVGEIGQPTKESLPFIRAALQGTIPFEEARVIVMLGLVMMPDEVLALEP